MKGQGDRAPGTEAGPASWARCPPLPSRNESVAISSCIYHAGSPPAHRLHRGSTSTRATNPSPRARSGRFTTHRRRGPRRSPGSRRPGAGYTTTIWSGLAGVAAAARAGCSRRDKLALGHPRPEEDRELTDPRADGDDDRVGDLGYAAARAHLTGRDNSLAKSGSSVPDGARFAASGVEIQPVYWR